MNSDEQNIQLGIFTNPGIVEKPFVWRGKTYNFKVKEIPWAAGEKIISNSAVISKSGTMKIDTVKYTIDTILASVVDTDGMFNVDNMTVMKLSEELVMELEKQGVINLISSEDNQEYLKN